jgi:hypothetical protein
MRHGREKRERRERGEASVTSWIQRFWWAARISNTGRWDEKTSGRYIGFLAVSNLKPGKSYIFLGRNFLREL